MKKRKLITNRTAKVIARERVFFRLTPFKRVYVLTGDEKIVKVISRPQYEDIRERFNGQDVQYCRISKEFYGAARR